MLDKNHMRLGWGVLAGLLFGLSAVTGMLAAQRLEYHFMPVVTNTQITRTAQVDGGVMVWGTFDKVRDCRFIEANASSGPLQLDLEFKDERKNRAATRSIGPQTFGPWYIAPSMFPLRVVVRHECLPLWYSTSVMLQGYTP